MKICSERKVEIDSLTFRFDMSKVNLNQRRSNHDNIVPPTYLIKCYNSTHLNANGSMTLGFVFISH